GDQGQVSLRVVLLEGGRVLGGFIDHRHDGGRCVARAGLMGVAGGGNHSGEAAGGKVGQVVGNLLKARGGHPFFEVVHRVEIQLSLPVERWLLAVGGGGELGEVGPHESNLLLVGLHQRKVGAGIVLLERGGVLGLVVEHRHDGHGSSRSRRGGGCRVSCPTLGVFVGRRAAGGES